MANTTDNQNVEGLLTTTSLAWNPTIQATSASILTLTVSSPSLLIFTGTTAGQIIRLGVANTYQNGAQYSIFNDSTQILTIQDSTGAQLYTLGVDQSLSVLLESNATAAGVWVFSASAGVHYLPATNLTELTSAVSFLQSTGGGTVHITGAINLVANLTLDMTNVRILSDTSIANAINFNGFVITLIGTGCYFGNVRFRGEVAAGTVRSQLLFNTTSNTPNFIWFDNCMFKNCIGGVYPNVALTPSGVHIDLTAAGANFTNVIFENCNTSQDWWTSGGTSPVGLCVRNCHGAANKYLFITGHVGQTEARNRFILAPLSGTAVAGTNQAFITDGSGVHNGAFEIPSLGNNYYSRSRSDFATRKFLALTSGSIFSLEPDSMLNADNSFVLIDASTADQTITLPSTPNYADGCEIYLHKNGLYNLIINQSAPDTVNGTTSYTSRGTETDLLVTFRESTGDWYVQEVANKIISTVNTTTATPTVLVTYNIPTNSVVLLTATIMARRTGGTSGTNGDCAAYKRTAKFKNVGGTVTMLGLSTDYTHEDVAAYNATLDVSGTTARIMVTGVATTNITWTSNAIIEVLV
jgi:hypothetical protein